MPTALRNDPHTLINSYLYVISSINNIIKTITRHILFYTTCGRQRCTKYRTWHKCYQFVGNILWWSGNTFCHLRPLINLPYMELSRITGQLNLLALGLTAAVSQAIDWLSMWSNLALFWTPHRNSLRMGSMRIGTFVNIAQGLLRQNRSYIF